MSGSRSGEVRVGIVGTGFGKRVHLPGFQAAPGLTITAICSADLGRAQEAALECGAPHAFDDYQKMVDSDEVDLVSVATPPRLHAAVTEAALRAGKHVLTEKPFAMNVDEAQRLVALAAQSDVVAAVVHEMRYIPARRHLRDLVASGFLGDVRAVMSTVYADYAVNPSMEPYYYGWVNVVAEGGGYLNSLLSHHIDLMRFTFGELHGVTGTVSQQLPERPELDFEYRDGDPIGPETKTIGMRAVDADDGATLTARLANGALVTLGGSWVVHGGAGERLEAYGSEGTLRLEGGRVLGARAGETGFAEIPLPEELKATEAAGPYMVPFFAGLAGDLRAAIVGDSDRELIYATFADALRVQEITDLMLARS
jgi:predicted dehydrogenase